MHGLALPALWLQSRTSTSTLFRTVLQHAARCVGVTCRSDINGAGYLHLLPLTLAARAAMCTM